MNPEELFAFERMERLQEFAADKNLKALVSGSSKASYKLFPLSKLFGLPLWIADKFVDNWFRSTLVKSAIRSFKPQLVHAMELQNAGYIAAKAINFGIFYPKFHATDHFLTHFFILVVQVSDIPPVSTNSWL